MPPACCADGVRLIQGGPLSVDRSGKADVKTGEIPRQTLLPFSEKPDGNLMPSLAVPLWKPFWVLGQKLQVGPVPFPC
jgi:hypothetical protein